jgi:Putative MetA-pathway of phenol degradation
MAHIRSVARVLFLAIVLVGLTPSAARAQQSDAKLSEILFGLYVDTFLANVDEFGGLGTLVINQETVERLLATPFGVNQLMAIQVSSFPLGSSAGGFSWTFDPALGTFNRLSSSFGPVFSERALTIGRRRLNFGMNYQRATFDKIEGQVLRDGEIRTYTGLGFADDYVAIEDALDLKLTTQTVGLFATYGITDRIDIGVAIPIVSIDLQARLDSRLLDSFGSAPEALEAHSDSGSATGVGDIVVRGKYNFWRGRGGGLAVGVDWRLPTGDEEELTGIAGAQGKFYVAASSAYGRLSPHANFGYTISGDTTAARSTETAVFAPPDEFGYAAGVDFAVTPRLTVVGDVVGRAIQDTVRLDIGPIFLPDLLTLDPTVPTPFTGFTARDGNLHQVLGSVGAKFNPMGNALLSFNVLFPLKDVGLRDNLTWVGGFEWSF